MNERILITGGAGFIGSRVARQLLALGYPVAILDNFSPQIHGESGSLPSDLRDHVELFRGDVRDADLCARALEGCRVLVHLAAETGTGQSMYRIRHYTDVNIQATSTLMELLLSGRYPVQSLVVASSRSIYGEGAARCATHGLVYPPRRSTAAMKVGQFEPECPFCTSPTTMEPTCEDAPFHPLSLYGLTKQVQEQMTLLYAATLGINGFALRYQNVYGPGQSLRNPYTGILAIFSNRARAHEDIFIFEDGRESRDFVFVDDVVEATVRAIQAQSQPPIALNVGSGVATTVSEVVQHVVTHFSSHSRVLVNGAFREGDIRHNCADLTRLRQHLGFSPSTPFATGLRAFLDWAASEEPTAIPYEQSLEEMRKAGLFHDTSRRP